jgi:hypothetical protein
MRYNMPLDPECPTVIEYQQSTADDPIMVLSSCADEFYAAFAHKHRATCTRCQEFGVANIEVT